MAESGDLPLTGREPSRRDRDRKGDGPFLSFLTGQCHDLDDWATAPLLSPATSRYCRECRRWISA